MRAKENEGKLIIEGYFAVFNKETQLRKREFEVIRQGAFTETLNNREIKALFNHDTSFVLGSLRNKTLQLWEDEQGLYGIVEVNPEDKSAVDIYNRVKRGDITKCSMGFGIQKQKRTRKTDGYHYEVEKVELYEVSICPFPAYEDTSIHARAYLQTLEQKKEHLKNRLKGE